MKNLAAPLGLAGVGSHSKTDRSCNQFFDWPLVRSIVESHGGELVAGNGDLPTAPRAMKQGAVDFLTKPFDAEELILAVKRALERAEEQLRRCAERREARRRMEKLTPREFEVLRFVVMGLLNKQIAAELHTAEKTIKVHRGRVMQKLGVTSVADLVRISQRAGVSPTRKPA